MTLREQLTTHVEEALAALYRRGFLTGNVPPVILAPPKQASHGDYACTVALALAKAAGKKPKSPALVISTCTWRPRRGTKCCAR
jgi:arginyl-tRNA synthetase